MSSCDIPVEDRLPEPKPAHTGYRGPPLGPTMYVVVRHDGKIVAVKSTRHDALGIIVQCHEANDFEIVPVPIGLIPLMDLGIPEGFQ